MIYLNFLKKVYRLRTNPTAPFFAEKLRVYFLLLFKERKSHFLQTNLQVENRFNGEF